MTKEIKIKTQQVTPNNEQIQTKMRRILNEQLKENSLGVYASRKNKKKKLK